jgi:hypothetical protein
MNVTDTKQRILDAVGDADDAVLLAEQVQCLDGLFGETHDPAGRELAHGERMATYGSIVTVTITREVIAGLGEARV